jgi:ribonuclease BN (tRNA processing enzyme)/energy-coupling factor transporter ATP-binding protein EcfA2
MTETLLNNQPSLPPEPAVIIDAVLDVDRRVLLIGQPGSGKSTLVNALAQRLGAAGRDCWCIGADPGSPPFGVPGAVCLARWRDAGWGLVGLEALCTLDAGRFRLPLVQAVRRLARQLPPGVILVDGPGVVRGVAGAELVLGIAEATAIEAVLVLIREGRPVPLGEELRALPAAVFTAWAAPEAQRPAKRQRARARTVLWDLYLAGAASHRVDLERVNIVGTPPPRAATDAWTGRQVALLDRDETKVMGEVTSVEGPRLWLKLPSKPGDTETLLVRDARRLEDGCLGTDVPYLKERVEYRAAPTSRDEAPAAEPGEGQLVTRVGMIDVTLLNGVFGDPLLHLRLRHQRRSLLFDLGEGARLSARAAHRVSDVFISHAHIDHISGFLWLLRSRIGDFPVCRMYGPPGLAANIDGLMRGILWDRVADRGPCFEVAELHGMRLLRFRVQGGRPSCEPLEERGAPDGILLTEPEFRVRATRLDHISSVLAFSFEPTRQINVRKDRLLAMGLSPGPWLRELKQHLQTDQGDAPVRLPDGRTESAGTLAADLVLVRPGKKLVYATDFADTPDNRRRLITLARGAHTFFCEATFRETDAEQARRTAHLTTRACGEIAAAADVARLIPFHFSRRYETDPGPLYDEIADVCAAVAVPVSIDGAID